MLTCCQALGGAQYEGSINSSAHFYDSYRTINKAGVKKARENSFVARKENSLREGEYLLHISAKFN